MSAAADTEHVICEICSRVMFRFSEKGHRMQHMVEIVPQLYLGSRWNAEDSVDMKYHAITHILNIAWEVLDAEHTGVIHLSGSNFKFDDDPRVSLLIRLDPILEVIHQTITKHCTHRVLVHCQAGRSRSPSIIIAYLMKYEKMSFLAACKLVNQKNSSTCPNAGFQEQLRQYELQLHKGGNETFGKTDSDVSPPSIVTVTTISTTAVSFSALSPDTNIIKKVTFDSIKPKVISVSPVAMEPVADDDDGDENIVTALGHSTLSCTSSITTICTTTTAITNQEPDLQNDSVTTTTLVLSQKKDNSSVDERSTEANMQ